MYKTIFVLGVMLGLCDAGATEIVLTPLEEVTWSIRGPVDDTVEIPTAMALSAQGKRIEANYTDITITEAAVYDSPLRACIAAIHAIIEMNEAWWGAISAPWSSRGSDGVPLPNYTPDSGENMYRAFTYHSVNSEFPQTVDAKIKTYLRVGGLHAFDIEWTQVAGGVTTPGIRFILTFQEGPSSRFRLAPEWMVPFGSTLKDFLANTEQEDSATAAYRMEISSRTRSVPIFGLFGGDASTFPLTLHYRGGVPEESPHFAELEAFRANYTSAVNSVPKVTGDFPGSTSRTELADLLAGDGLQMLDEQDHVGRVYNPFRKPFVYVIESSNYVLAFNKDDDTNRVNPGFLVLYKDGENFKWVGFHTKTVLDGFLSEDPIWPKLEDNIQSVLEPGE